MGQFMNNKIQKGRKPAATFEVLGAKAELICTIPAHSPTQRVLDHLRHSSSPTPRCALILTPLKGPTWLLLGEGARVPVTHRASPNKAWTKLIIWPVINFH